MSVRDKIEEIKSDIANAYEAVSNKGGSIPSVSGSANLAQAIASIPEGGGSSDLEYEWWSPHMTSDTTPEPYVVSASTYSTDSVKPYNAFDENKETYWSSVNDTTHWIQIDIGENRKNVEIAGISISTKGIYFGQLPTGFIIRGSNDGFVWTDILKVDDEAVLNPESYYSREYYFKPSHYRYYKLYITNWPDFDISGSKVRIYEILFYRAIGNSYAVTSFNGRTGDILPQDGDYSAENISFSSGSLKAGNVKEAIEELANNPKEETQSTFLVKAPVGTIVIWSGTENDIPKGWELCDGTNGTPNLKDKFVLGAGEKYSVGDEGGEEEVALTKQQMPEHKHGFAARSGSAIVGVNKATYGVLNCDSSGSSSNNYTFEEGSSQPHENMPPYYTLCYIMKVTSDETDISAEDVIFEPGETGLEATNIQQAIEELAERGGGSSSGTVTPDLSDVSSMKCRQVTLLSTLWEEDGTQTVSCSDVIENDKGQLIVTIPDPNDEDAYFQSNIRPVRQLNDQITFRADTIPDSEIVVDVYILSAVEIKEEITGEFEWWSPKMTSDTEPAPYVASGCAPDQSYFHYKAFDNDSSTRFESANKNEEQYLQFDFGKRTTISGIKLQAPRDSSQFKYMPKSFSLEGSNDDRTWFTIYHADGSEYPDVNGSEIRIYEFNPKTYRYYKLILEENYATVKYMSIAEFEFYKLKEETT